MAMSLATLGAMMVELVIMPLLHCVAWTSHTARDGKLPCTKFPPKNADKTRNGKAKSIVEKQSCKRK